MAKKREWTKATRGSQLITAGEVINLMDQGTMLKCRVLSCLAMEDGRCRASMEIIEGPRKGERLKSVLKAGGETPGED